MKLILVVFCSLLLTITTFTQDLSSPSNTQSDKSLTMKTDALPQNAKYDFDGDGKADIAVFRPSDGYWYILKSSGGHTFVQWGKKWDYPAAGDYDGDGRADFAVYRRGSMVVRTPADAKSFWYILRSSDNSVFQTEFGDFAHSAVPEDYDGDGKTDLAIALDEDFVPAEQILTIRQSSDGTFRKVRWGFNSDYNVIADYDGDRKADVAVFGKDVSRQDREGIWYILQSSNQKARYEFFGAGEDQSVPSDYDGDGRADIAVFRPSNGFWYILQSSDSKFTAVQFGMPKPMNSAEIDLPVPADYDGDGKTDIAVYRTTTGTWYLLQSSKGFAAVQWGMQEDIPIPSRAYSY